MLQTPYLLKSFEISTLTQTQRHFLDKQVKPVLIDLLEPWNVQQIREAGPIYVQKLKEQKIFLFHSIRQSQWE